MHEFWLPESENVFVTDEQEEFLRVVWNSQCCDVVVDEAGLEIGHYGKTMIQLATQGRHWGHNCIFITQRANMVSPNVRQMCSIVLAFQQWSDGARVLAQEFNKPELLEIPNLPLGTYFVIQRGKPVEKRRLF